MDTPGHGNSDDPPRDYQIEDLAGVVIDFLDGLGIDRSHLAGHHTGAMIAVEVAAAYPQRVNKLFLSGCPARYYEQSVSKEITEPPSQSRPTWEFDITSDGQFLIKAWEIYQSIAVPGLSLDRLFTEFVITLGQSTRRYTVPTHQYNIQPRLGLIQSPTLLVSGSADWFLDELESTKTLLPRCRTRVIPGYGLFPSVENPQGFAQAILNFLEDPQA